MSDLSAEEVTKILDNRPAGMSPEDVIHGLQEHGYNLLPPTEAKGPQTDASQLKDFALNAPTHTTSAGPMGMGPGMLMSGLNNLAYFGSKLDKRVHEGTQMMADAGYPKIAKAINTGEGLLVPTTPLSVASTALGGAMGMEPKPTDLIPAEGTKIVNPGPVAKTVGGLASVSSRVNPRFTSLVAADPTILNDSTKSVAQVSKEMGSFFKEKGVDLGSEEFKNLFNQTWFPSENQVSKLQGIVDPTMERITNYRNLLAQGLKQEAAAVKPSESELIFAERAANAIKRSTAAASNRSMFSYANGAQGQLVDELSKSGFGELKSLKADYLRALAKEAFNDVLPKNKFGTPNALSTLLMAKKGKDAAVSAYQGDYQGALGSAAEAAAFSPLAVGQAFKAYGALANGASNPAVLAAGAAGISNFLSGKKNNKK